MNQSDFLSAIVDIHNTLCNINVHGDDAIRMADTIQKCRSLVYTLNQEKEQAKEDNG